MNNQLIVFFSIVLIGFFKVGDANPFKSSDDELREYRLQQLRHKPESGPTIHPHIGAIIRHLDTKLAAPAAPIQPQQVNQEPVSHHPEAAAPIQHNQQQVNHPNLNLAAVPISHQHESSSHRPEPVHIEKILAAAAAVPTTHHQGPNNNHSEVVHHMTKLAAIPAVINQKEPNNHQSGVVHHETKLAVAAPVIQEPVRVNLKAVHLDMKVAVAVPVNHHQESASHHPEPAHETVGTKHQMEATTVAHQQHPLENSKLHDGKIVEPQHHVVKREAGKRSKQPQNKKTKGSKKPVRAQPRRVGKREASEHEVDHHYQLGAVHQMAGNNHHHADEPHYAIVKRESENKGEHHKSGDKHHE